MAQTVYSAVCELNEGVRMNRMGRLFAQNDKFAHAVEVRVLQGGADADLSGLMASGFFIRADDSTVNVTGEITGSTARIALPQACYEVPGHFSLVIKVYDTDHSTAVFWGDGTITRTETDSLVDPAHVVPDLSALLAQIATIEAATTAANSAASAANTVAGKLENLSVSAASGASADADVSTVGGHYHIAFTMEKGDKGDTGDTGPTGKGIASSEVKYQAGANGSAIPTGTWHDTPAAAGAVQGQYLWTRTVLTFTDNTAQTAYSVAYLGLDGTGSTPVDFSGATASTNGTHGLVPQPDAGEQDKMLFGDGDWGALALDQTDSTTGRTLSLKHGTAALASATIPVSTVSNATGLMTYDDRIKLNSVQSSATHSLSILLWTNPDPSANFGAQTVTPDFGGFFTSSFDYILFEFYYRKSGQYLQSMLVRADYDGDIALRVLTMGSKSGGRNAHFVHNAETGDQIAFEAASFDGSANQEYCIPYKISGIILGERRT